MNTRRKRSAAKARTPEEVYRALLPQHQRLAELLAKGWTATGAHELAFPDSQAKRKNRPDMVRQLRSEIPGLEDTIAWLSEQAAARAGLSLARCQEVLAAIIDGDPADTAPWLRGEVELEDVPERARLALAAAEMDVATAPDGLVTVKRKLRRETKTAALRLAMEALGGLKKSPESEKADALRDIAKALGKLPEEISE